MSRILPVARLHLVGWRSSLGWPWAILGISFAVNLAVFASIGDVPNGAITGGLSSIYIVVLIVWSQAITQVFPFAMALSVTRREFYVATALVVVAESLGFALVLYLFKLLEDATGGWGLSVRFFAPGFVAQDNPVTQILVYAVPLLAMSFAGIFCAVVFKRWGLNGVFTLMVAAAVLAGGAVVLITRRGWWEAVGHWLLEQPVVSLVAGWPALLAVALAGAGFLAIRRASP
jgi:hypothetical protein